MKNVMKIKFYNRIEMKRIANIKIYLHVFSLSSFFEFNTSYFAFILLIIYFRRVRSILELEFTKILHILFVSFVSGFYAVKKRGQSMYALASILY